MLPVESLGESFQGKLFYVTFIENKEDLQPLYDILRKKDTFNSVFQQEIYRTEYWCEIMPNAVSKAKTAISGEDTKLLNDSFLTNEPFPPSPFPAHKRIFTVS